MDVLDGNQAPSPKGVGAPNFSAHICCGQMAGWMKMKLGKQVGLGPGHIVLHRDPAPPPQKGSGDPQLLAHICCGQMAGRIKMPLGREIGLSPSDIVLDGDPTPPPPKGAEPPIFGPCLLWPNGWMDQDATWYEGRPRPRPHCVTWGPSSPSQKGPNFRPTSIVAKRSPISVTAELLYFISDVTSDMK